MSGLTALPASRLPTLPPGMGSSGLTLDVAVPEGTRTRAYVALLLNRDPAGLPCGVVGDVRIDGTHCALTVTKLSLQATALIRERLVFAEPLVDVDVDGTPTLAAVSLSTMPDSIVGIPSPRTDSTDSHVGVRLDTSTSKEDTSMFNKTEREEQLTLLRRQLGLRDRTIAAMSPEEFDDAVALATKMQASGKPPEGDDERTDGADPEATARAAMRRRHGLWDDAAPPDPSARVDADEPHPSGLSREEADRLDAREQVAREGNNRRARSAGQPEKRAGISPASIHRERYGVDRFGRGGDGSGGPAAA